MTSSKPAKKKKSNVITVNFEGVETRTKIPDDNYHAKVKGVEKKQGDKAQYLEWQFALVTSNKLNGRTVYYNTSLAPQSLWNLRNLLETLGIETPESEFRLDLSAPIDLELMIRIENEAYQGKERPKVTDFSPLEETAEVDNDEADDEEEAEEEEAEEEEESPDEEESGDEEADEEESESAEDSDDDDGADEADEEEEEDDGKVSRASVSEMKEEQLAELITRFKLKVDLKKYSKLGKKMSAVLDVLEAKGLLKG